MKGFFRLVEEFCDFLQQCLVTDLGNSNTKLCDGICNTSHNSIKNNLPKGSVLERILAVQMLDQDGTHSTYKKLTKSDIWDDFSYVEKLLDLIGSSEGFCSKCMIVEVSKRLENELLFLPYLVSAIAKDCSLMITFRRIQEDLR